MSEELTGADSLARTLVNCGVEVCFANPGTSEIHFVSALDRIDGIRPVLALFEGVATGAADGYARMTGRPAATLMHLGPGLGNGLANLHNARKAQVPMVNVVGDHATTHARFDAPLTSDVAGFAAPVSDWVHTSRSARTVAADAARAVQAALAPPGQISTLILPADASWSPAERPANPLPVAAAAPVSDEAVAQAAAAVRSAGPVAFLLRGSALLGDGLRAAGAIAARTGARLFSDTFAPRVARGAGRPLVERLPYRPADVLACLADVRTLIIVGSQPPVAFFGYPDQPSELTPATCTPLTLAHPHEDGPGALRALAEAIGARGNGKLTAYQPPPPVSAGPLTAEQIAHSVARNLPDNAIVCDEAVTGSFAAYPLLATTVPHDVLQSCGGAIGDGLPLAIGAAIASPNRKVLTLTGDGSAMYTVQALWTQAREHLDVTTVVYSNRSYRVLDQELSMVNAGAAGPRARGLLDLNGPDLDWVKIAEGLGVEATVVDDGESLDKALNSAFSDSGPHLIEAVL